MPLTSKWAAIWAGPVSLDTTNELFLINDPNLDKNAKLIKDITYSEVISKNLRVMDLTAISLAKESGIPIYITNIFEEDSLIRALKEEGNYSKIHWLWF